MHRHDCTAKLQGEACFWWKDHLVFSLLRSHSTCSCTWACAPILTSETLTTCFGRISAHFSLKILDETSTSPTMPCDGHIHTQDKSFFSRIAAKTHSSLVINSVVSIVNFTHAICSTDPHHLHALGLIYTALHQPSSVEPNSPPPSTPAQVVIVTHKGSTVQQLGPPGVNALYNPGRWTIDSSDQRPLPVPVSPIALPPSPP